MKTFLIVVLFGFFSLNTFAERTMMVIQAYEMLGEPSDGELAASVTILNISNLDQTVSWSGGFWPNRVQPGQNTSIQDCSYHTSPPPSHTKASVISEQKARIAPNGFITLWCYADTNDDQKPAGSEGVLKMEFTIEEDRGAVMGSGSIYAHDRWSLANSNNLRNWGATGAGPFLINGGRAF